jgi:transposase InsO family protein
MGRNTHDRQIVGWAMADHMRTELVTTALNMAFGRRRPRAGLLHHSELVYDDGHPN